MPTYKVFYTVNNPDLPKPIKGHSVTSGESQEVVEKQVLREAAEMFVAEVVVTHISTREVS